MSRAARDTDQSDAMSRAGGGTGLDAVERVATLAMVAKYPLPGKPKHDW